MSPFDLAIRCLRRRIAAFLVLRRALALLALWLFLWGTAVLVLRVGAGLSPLVLLWGLAAVPVLLAAAVLLALRQVPGRAALCAALDRSGGCGGLLMAAEERPLGGWEQAAPSPGQLHVRWHGGRTWTVFLSGLAFVAVALMMPDSLTTPAPAAHALEIGREADKLVEKVTLLKEEKIFEPERADRLKEKLDQLKQDASGANPVKTLDALDHVEKQVTQAAREAAEKAAQKTEELAQGAALAEALQKSGDALDPKVKADALAELGELAKKAASEQGAAGKHLDPEALKALKEGKLRPEQMEALAKALKAGQGDLSKLVEKLAKARLIDPELLKKCEGACKSCDAAALAEFLKECKGNCSVADALKACNRPGRGGVNEGPGAAELTFGDKTTEAGAKSKEEALPPAELEALRKSNLLGTSREAPDKEKAGPSRPGALSGAKAGGGSAQTQVILPRHRPAVERYFERPGGQKAGGSKK
jgi:hypothetical protein